MEKYIETFGNVIIHLSKEREDTIAMGDTELYLDGTHSSKNIRNHGEVLAAPKKLPSKPYVREEEGYLEMGNLKDVTPQVKPGDTAYFLYNAVQKEELKTDSEDGGITLCLPYDYLVAVSRGGKVQMLNNWIALERLETEEQATDSGIVFDLGGKAVPGRAKIVYCCENDHGLEEGQIVEYHKSRKFTDKIDGEEYLLLQHHNIFGIDYEASL